MTIRVRLFAILKDLARAAEIPMELPPDATAGDAVKRLAAEKPALAAYLGRCALAVNQSYAPASTPLHDGDELAIIPPVSGG